MYKEYTQLHAAHVIYLTLSLNLIIPNDKKQNTFSTFYEKRIFKKGEVNISWEHTCVLTLGVNNFYYTPKPYLRVIHRQQIWKTMSIWFMTASNNYIMSNPSHLPSTPWWQQTTDLQRRLDGLFVVYLIFILWFLICCF